MNKKLLFFKKSESFTQWSNKAWSIFFSIGKHIVIRSLPLSYFLFAVFTLQAQTDTLQLQEVRINSARIASLYSETARIIYTIDKKDIEAMPVHSLQDLLEYVGNADIRARGTEGVQADVGIRGGNFDQTLILLNGFKISDSQTGHHSLNLPVDINSIERIEILEGPGNRIFGINAYSGAINFITDSQTERRLKAGFFAGQNNLFGGFASASHHIKNFSNYISASYKRSDGYLSDSIGNTDFNTLNIFYHTQLNTKPANFSLQAGYTDKSFGANSFYTPAFPWQYEQVKTSFAGLKTQAKIKFISLENRLYYRRHQDRFELFREDKYQRSGKYFINNQDTAKFVPGIYQAWNYYKGHNYHLTDNLAAELKLNLQTKAGRTAVGAEYSYTQIKSNVLGEPLDNTVSVPGEPHGLFTKFKAQNNVNIYAEHLFAYKKIMFSAGGSLNINSQFKQFFSGGIDLSYALPFDGLKSFLSINRSARLPSYTDLYYDGPTNKGNPDLKPETALNYEVGFKYISGSLNAHCSFFRREGKNTIDWVRLSDTLEWQTANITELTTNGLEFAVNYTFPENRFLQGVRFSYAYTDITKQSGEYISKYALDYLKHKAVLSVKHEIYKRISASWNMRFEDRNGTFSAYDRKTRTYTGEVAYSPYLLTDLRVLWQLKRLEIYADASNLFNVKYFEFGNIQMPGRLIKVGVKLNLSY